MLVIKVKQLIKYTIISKLEALNKVWFFCKGDKNLIKIEFDRLSGSFTGTGDAFASMVFAWYTKLNDLKVFIIDFNL